MIGLVEFLTLCLLLTWLAAGLVFFRWRRRRAEAEALRLAKQEAELEVRRELDATVSELSSILTNASVGICIVKPMPDGRRILQRVNPAMERMLGYAPGELVGLDTRILAMNVADYDLIGVTYAETINRGKTYQGESPFRRKDGQGILCSMRGSALDPEDLSKGAVWLLQDITERVQMELELARQTKLLRDGADNQPGMLVIWDSDLRYVYWSKRAESYFNLPPGTLYEGLPYADVLRIFAARGDFGPGDVDALVEERIQRLHKREVLVEERRLPDGTVLDVRRRPLPSGGYVSVAQDITERKRAETELLKSKQALATTLNELELILDNASLGIASIFLMPDGSRHIRHANRALERMLGYASGALVGQDTRLIYGSAREYTDMRAVYEQRFAEGMTYQGEHEFRAQDGHAIQVSVFGTAVDFSDLSQGTIWLLEDISARKTIERELVHAKEVAEAANRSKSSFLANMSHEIRTPMNGVLGMLDLLQDTGLTATQRELTAVAHQSAENLLRLINDILDISKIEAGKLLIECTDFDLLDEVESVIRLQYRAAEKKGLELLLDYPLDMPHAMIGDPMRIRQVLMNLVGNALKFTMEGHVLIRVNAELQDDGCYRVGVTVSDTGIGISEDQCGRLFDKFTQADVSTTRQFGGSGLGLSICKQLLELMGGEIGVESRRGQGSRFWFFLTLAPGSEAIRNFEAMRDVRVLLVDAHATASRLMQAQLSQIGMRPQAVADGDAALSTLRMAAAEGDPYTIAVLNARFSTAEADALGSAIRADANLQDLRLVLLASLSSAVDAARFAQAGFSALLSKPVAQQTLVKTLSELCAAHRRGEHGNFVLALSSESAPPVSDRQVGALTGCRLLLVDDNDVNQQVGAGLLHRLGCTVDLAANGQQAVEMYCKQAYDLILMDCQMPELDGYQATREIREVERLQARARVVIIALTAHALSEDRDKCLAAGMDDYLPKPIRPSALAAVLSRCVPRGGKSIDPPDDEDEVVDDFDDVQDLVGESFRDIAAKLLASFPQRLADLREAARQPEPSALAAQAHALGGSCSSVGARRLAKVCKALETAARDGRLDEVDARLAVLAKAVTQSEFHLRRFISSHE